MLEEEGSVRISSIGIRPVGHGRDRRTAGWVNEKGACQEFGRAIEGIENGEEVSIDEVADEVSS